MKYGLWKKLIFCFTLVVLLVSSTFIINENDGKIGKSQNTNQLNAIEKPAGITAFTINGENTNLSYNELINSYVIDKVTCKNGSTAVYDKIENSLSLSNIKIPDYCTMNFKHTIYSKLLSDNPTVKTRSDFSQNFTESNTSTLYKSSESINGSTSKTVYYFAGNAQNNWVKFAGYYWRIIRTNADGSVRLLFSGTSPDTNEAYIGKSKFNEDYNSPKYVGYMYGDTDATLAEARTNKNDSTIKAFVDNWYEKNFTKYTKYLSKSSVYCNNRSVTNGEEYSLTSTFFYSGYYRTHYTKGLFTEINFDCPDIKDAFSVNNTEAKLKYPIALITGEEIVAAGGKVDTNATVWYSLNSNNESITGDMWWSTMTPDYFNTTTSNVWRVVGTENLGRYRGGNVYYVNSVRPVISIASCALYSSGDGSAESPYEVNGGC